MHIDGGLTDEAVLRELGQRLQRRRIDSGLSQAVLADSAGVAKRTLERLESGHTVDLTTLIRLLRALGLMDLLESFVPESPPSPMALLKGRGKVPKRAPRRGLRARERARQSAATPAAERRWTWKE
jgi:transcriptional regulator with XRE-family HTH domain